MNNHDQGCCCPHHVDEQPASRWPWFLLLLAAVLAVAPIAATALGYREALGAAVTVLLVAPLAAWVAGQVFAEVRFRQLYDRPGVPTRRPVVEQLALPAAPLRALPPVPPLAAGRFVIDAEGTGGSR